jgi:hypothetical protein
MLLDFLSFHGRRTSEPTFLLTLSTIYTTARHLAEERAHTAGRYYSASRLLYQVFLTWSAIVERRESHLARMCCCHVWLTRDVMANERGSLRKGNSHRSRLPIVTRT